MLIVCMKIITVKYKYNFVQKKALIQFNNSLYYKQPKVNLQNSNSNLKGYFNKIFGFKLNFIFSMVN